MPDVYAEGVIKTVFDLLPALKDHHSGRDDQGWSVHAGQPLCTGQGQILKQMDERGNGLLNLIIICQKCVADHIVLHLLQSCCSNGLLWSQMMHYCWATVLAHLHLQTLKVQLHLPARLPERRLPSVAGLVQAVLERPEGHSILHGGVVVFFQDVELGLGAARQLRCDEVALDGLVVQDEELRRRLADHLVSGGAGQGRPVGRRDDGVQCGNQLLQAVDATIWRVCLK